MLKRIFILIIIVCAYNSVNCNTISQDIVVIVNNENPISQLTLSEAKLYWLKKIKKRWPELNKNIKPVDRKSKCPEQDLFYNKVLNMTSAEVENYFVQRQYSGAEKPQEKLISDEAIIEFVKNEPGAIGYVSRNVLTDKVRDQVKVVLIVN